MTDFILAVFVVGFLFGWGLTVGVILITWLHHRHVARIEQMEKKAYADVRFMEIKRVNMEGEKRLRERQKYAEIPTTPEEEERSWIESRKALGYTDEEVEKLAKERRKL